MNYMCNLETDLGFAITMGALRGLRTHFIIPQALCEKVTKLHFRENCFDLLPVSLLYPISLSDKKRTIEVR